MSSYSTYASLTWLWKVVIFKINFEANFVISPKIKTFTKYNMELYKNLMSCQMDRSFAIQGYNDTTRRESLIPGPAR